MISLRCGSTLLSSGFQLRFITQNVRKFGIRLLIQSGIMGNNNRTRFYAVLLGVLLVFCEISDCTICEFCGADFVHLGKHVWHCKQRIQPVNHPTVDRFKIQDSRFKIQDSRFKIQDSRFKIQDSRFKIQDSRFKIQDSRFKIQDSRFKIQDSRFKVQDSRFKIQDSRFKIQDSRFKIQDSRYIYILLKLNITNVKKKLNEIIYTNIHK